MALKILIVDPDDEWLFSAKEFFEGINYQATVVNNGKDAQMSLYNGSFFAVILNVNVKNHAGIQVLKFIRSNHPSQKVIMVTEIDEGEDIEDQWNPEKLKKAGATEVIVRPFELADLKELLEGHQSIGDMVSTIPRRKELVLKKR